MNVAGPTIQADWTGGSGDQGTGVKVGIIEYRSVHNTGDMAGKVIGWYNATANNNTPCYDTPPNDHPTWVAAAVAGQNATYKGVAPGAQILSGATCGSGTANDSLVIEAADWALAQGADILNLSLVQDTASGAETARTYFDSVVANQLDNVVAASGNLGGACGTPAAPGSEAVGSPGVGWNVLTVGGVNDQGTTSHGDDRLWYSPPGSGACWVDPDGTVWNPFPDPDFNKPEVSAPAVNVRTTSSPAILQGTGTSVAAPIVSGIVAQLLGRSAIAKANPNLAKALVMAGAIWGAPLPSGVYSTDHQGIGYVSAKWANNALIDEGGGTGGYHTGTFSSLITYTKTFGITYGQYVQVATVFNSRPYGANPDQLTADLDLVVTFPDGTVKTSDSARNAWEYVDHQSSAAGTVTVRVTAYRLDTVPQPFALAWIKSSAP